MSDFPAGRQDARSLHIRIPWWRVVLYLVALPLCVTAAALYGIPAGVLVGGGILAGMAIGAL